MFAILTDVTKCVGCQRCVKGCRKVNGCAPERPEQKAEPQELFDTRWTAVVRKSKSESQPRFVRRHCRHCLNPACVAACPVGAMTKTAEGPVMYNKKRCMGCRYCMMACPYGIPRYEWNSLVPGIQKCIFCHERVLKGGQPGCTEACLEEATIFGDRTALLNEARNRIRNSPDRYLSRIWGEKELGGTSVLYISDISLDFLAIKSPLTEESIPNLALPAIRDIMIDSGALGISLGLLRWIINRRNKLHPQKGAQNR